jgi:hypothetical protein
LDERINDTFTYSSQAIYGSFCKSNDGGYLITGQTDFTLHGLGRPFIIKTDSALNILWGKKYSLHKNIDFSSFITQLPGGDHYRRHYLRLNCAATNQYSPILYDKGGFKWSEF